MYLDQSLDQGSSPLHSERNPASNDVVRHLRDLANRLELEAGLGGQAEPPRSTKGQLERSDYLLKVRAVLAERANRRRIFGSALVESPIWAILLDLFEAYHAQKSRCVKSSCLASGVPATTALRYLSLIEDLGFIERRPDPCDKRRILIGLTATGLRKLHQYFDDL